jgi:hypothetical protein
VAGGQSGEPVYLHLCNSMVAVDRSALYRRNPIQPPSGHTNAIAGGFVGTIRRELLDRLLIINQRHGAAVLREFEYYYNGHRPHRSLAQAAPLRPLPHRPTTEILKIHRRDRLGGLLHEYQQAA